LYRILRRNAFVLSGLSETALSIQVETLSSKIERETEDTIMPKTRTSPTAVKKFSRAKTAPTQDDIALRAYRIYQERGCTPGDPMEDWLKAERELTGRPVKAGRKSKVVSIAA
jgi:hypothetical protein